MGLLLMEAIEARFPAASRFAIFIGDRSERALGLYSRPGYRSFKAVPAGTHRLVFMEKVRASRART